MAEKLAAEIVLLFKSTARKLQFLEIPFVVHHFDCFELGRAISLAGDGDWGAGSKHIDSDYSPTKDDLLDLDILDSAVYAEVRPFIKLPEIRDAYIQLFGSKYLSIESNIKPKKNPKEEAVRVQSKCLSETTIKVIALQLQSTMATQLQQATSVILAQDFYLQEIASELIYHAQQAEDYMGYVEELDIQYKQCVLTLCFSLIRAGLAAFGASGIMDICESLSLIAEISERGVESIQEHLVNTVGSMQNIVAFEHSQALLSSEEELISTTESRDIARRWTAYRASVYRKAYASLQNIWTKCINSEDFMRCVIKQAAQSYPHISTDKLLLCASTIARSYIADILKPLQSQLRTIEKVRNSIKSEPGGIACQLYFRRMSLINYTLLHEHAARCTNRWISKKLGHQLARFFPDIVFQKKWTPIWLICWFKGYVKYAGEQLTRRHYFNRKRQAAIVLNLVRIGARSKETLFETMEELAPQLSDDLVQYLKEINEDTITDSTVAQLLKRDEPKGTLSRGRYSFRKRTMTLFDHSATEVGAIPDLSNPRVE